MLVGSQVSLKYDLDLSLTQVPENLIFYSDEEMTKAFLKENGAIHLDGTFLANDDNKTANRTIYWQWPIETGLTQTEIDNNDGLDSKWIGSDVILGIAATGKQIMGDPDEKYTVTLDLNGGTLANHGEATMLTKQVNYGETYGDLPVPTREGYRFVGWNGKNMINIADTNEISKNGVNFSVEDSVAKIKGINTYSTDYYLKVYYPNKYECNFEKNKTYTLSATQSLNGGYFQINYIPTNGEASSSNCLVRLSAGRTITFTIPDDYEKIHYYFVGIHGTTSDIDVNFSIQCEDDITSTEYEPYIISDTTPVSQNKNHTLTAIWEPISNP